MTQIAAIERELEEKHGSTKREGVEVGRSEVSAWSAWKRERFVDQMCVILLVLNERLLSAASHSCFMTEN